MTEAERFHVRLADWNDDWPKLKAIRYDVFVVEQRVPEDLEWDGTDGHCRHALAEDAAGRAIGCGRLLPDGHVGRMAVRPEWRGQGVGAEILDRLVDLAREMGHDRVVLNAQSHACGFYERHGFVPCGTEFDEAGIPHRTMVRTIR